MKVSIISEVSNINYFRSLRHLENIGQINKLNITSVKNIIKRPYKILNLISCLFADKIILGLSSPYHIFIIYFIILKKLKKKNVIFFTSWPDWSGKRYRWKPIFPGTKLLWDNFLNNITSVAITKLAKRELTKKGSISYHIPHSINIDIFKPQNNKKSNTIKVLFVGRLEKYKGINYIIDIAKELKEIEFLFVGNGKLKNFIINAGNKYSNIKYLGFIKDKKKLAEIYNQSSIFVMPSYKTKKWEELFGITIIEAMACGLPVIATDCVGPKEIIDNNKNGFIIPQNNKEALKNKILELIEDDVLRHNISRGAIIKAESYNLEEMADRWKKILYKN